MSRRLLWMAVLLLGLATLSGCCHTCSRSSTSSPYNSSCQSCSPATPLPPRLAPSPRPSARPWTPADTQTSPPPAAPYAPPAPADPLPANPDPGVRLEAPIPAEDEPPPARFYPPEEPLPRTTPPTVEEEPGSTPPLPVDIPRFDIVKDNIAGGQQPYPDGVTWLKERGYRTALFLLPAGEEDSAARRLFEKNGLRYLGLRVSPETLTEDVVQRFNEIVADRANRPLFVFDKDGSLTGGLWFLHFRLIDKLPNDKALAEVERLGFRQDDPDHTTMWIAVQKYLADHK
jgi:protein tyrosine phosphatase (PTP) superfamily phosphohydrolase (DUF442 family)